MLGRFGMSLILLYGLEVDGLSTFFHMFTMT